jgi:hypothetical protein
MYNRALVVFPAVDIGPFPFVQNAGCAGIEIARIGKDLYLSIREVGGKILENQNLPRPFPCSAFGVTICPRPPAMWQPEVDGGTL